MNTIYYGEDEYFKIVDDIAKDIFYKRMISIFGAGFTVGEKTNFGKIVPSGGQFMKYMIDEILKYEDNYPITELAELEFYELSSIYFETMEENNINIKKIFKELL